MLFELVQLSIFPHDFGYGRHQTGSAVAWIIKAARNLEKENIPDRSSLRSIEADPLLEKVVSQALG